MSAQYKDVCPICEFEIEKEDQGEVVHDIIGISVHKGKCLKQYKELLESKTHKKDGDILGACAECRFPVREYEDFSVFRCNDSEKRRLTTFPEFDEPFVFVHDDCMDKSNEKEQAICSECAKKLKEQQN